MARNTDAHSLTATSIKLDSEHTLMQVSALDFSEGMYVDADLYVKLGDNFVLLCSRSQLSRDLIARINDYGLTGSALYIDEDFYNHMGKHHRLATRGETETALEKEYRQFKVSTAEVLDALSGEQPMPWNKTSQLVTNIREQVATVQSPFILQCISALRNTDEFLCIHCVNVSLLNGLIAKWLGKSQQETDKLIIIGVLHDLGKLRISSNILDKPSRLTGDEFGIIKKHPVYGEQMLRRSGVSDPDILKAIRGHHEQMNGRGYPDGLTSDQIHEYSRITAISDIYDAMVARRVYKRPSSPFEVLDQFSKDRFSHLDICLVNLFLEKICVELVGRNAKLSDGRTGTVLYINRERLRYPIVSVEGKTVATSDLLSCTHLLSD